LINSKYGHAGCESISRMGILCKYSKYGTTSSKWQMARRFLLIDNEESNEEQHHKDSIQAAIENIAELSKPERASISQKH